MPGRLKPVQASLTLSGVSRAWIVQLERDHLFRESGGRKLERLVRDAYAWQIPHIYKQWLYTRAVMMHRLADALEIDFAVIFPTVYCENLGQRMWLTLYLIRKMHAALGANETYPTLSSNPSACWGWLPTRTVGAPGVSSWPKIVKSTYRAAIISIGRCMLFCGVVG